MTTAVIHHELTFPIPDGVTRLTLDAHFADVHVLHDAVHEIHIAFDGPEEFEPEAIRTEIYDDGRAIHVTVPPLHPDQEWIDIGDTIKRIMAAFGRSNQLSITARVPAGSDLDIQLTGGNIDVEGPAGRVRADTGGGRIRLQEASDIYLKSGGGNLVIENAQRAELSTGGGNIDARTLGEASVRTGGGAIRIGLMSNGTVRTGGGNVTIESAHGDLDVQTGGGEVRLGRTAAQTHVRTGGGAIHASVESGAIAAKTGAGNITVTVPPHVPVWQDLDSSFGQVRTRVSGRGEPKDGEPYIQVTARTGTGNILLKS